MIIETLRPILRSPEFLAGLRFGLSAFAVGLTAALVARTRRDPTTLAIAGSLFAAATLVALYQTLGLPAGLAIGVIMLGGAGGMAGLPVIGAPAALLVAVPGAWLVVWRSGLQLDHQMRLLVGTAIVFGGWLMADFDIRWRRQALGPVLLAISVAGVYTTVPDTEPALVALGAALPVALLGWPWPLAWLGRAGSWAATGLLLWVVGAGGVGRGSAVVGGVACLGLVAVEPAARLFSPGHRSILERLPSGRWAVLAVALLHMALVYLAARVAGLRPTATEAAAVALIEFAVAVVVLALAAAIVRSRLTTRLHAGSRPGGRTGP